MPKELETGYYFEDMTACPCKDAFENISYPWDALIKKDRLMSSLPKDLKGNVHPTVIITGHVRIGKNTIVHPYTVIEGPAVIGENCEIRPSVMIRSGTFIGNRVVVGHSTEIKNSIIFDDAKIASGVFAGDSIIGKGARIGSGVILGNRRFDQRMVTVKTGEKKYDTGMEKFGCIIGDYARLGANCTTSPGVCIGKHTWIGSNVLVDGCIRSDLILKLKQELLAKPKERLYLQRTDSRGNI
jgi:NDP-sugar pyrophosphorylase family protein